MVTPKDIVETAQVLLLFAFLGLTSLLFVVTMLNRSAIRNVVMVLPRGRLFGFPFAPVAFIVTVVALAGVSVFRAQAADAIVYSGYAMGGVLWLISQSIAKATYVTRFGFVRWLGGSHSRIAWSQVQDCFEVTSRRHQIFVLLYFDGSGNRKRYEIRVPRSKVDDFRSVLDRHIYWSEPMSSTSVIDLKTLTGE
ncbi:MAG: hypothetical protein HKN13_08260 [Rhodothermales bacterium]|nr:hypothetical protein [Rhodothermales bacterium]